jgi:glycosyltransferase involved in cell wall biosynthesis
MLPTALKCDRFIALNPTVVQELMDVGVPQWKIMHLPNGVETDEIQPVEHYALKDPIRLIFVGRLHPQKGLDTLFAALSQLSRNASVGIVELQLLGEGPIRSELVNLAGKLDICDLVTFVGETDQVIEAIQKADIFILPSRAEGISNALLEAMSCGLPVVVSDIPGNRDVIEHHHNGLCFTVDDPDSLTQNLLLLLNQPDLRAHLGANARQSVEQKFSMNFVADRYAKLYRDLISDTKTQTLPIVKLDKSRIQNDEA